MGAIECFCNMTLGDQKTCVKLAKLVTPYLMIYINNLNFNLSVSFIFNTLLLFFNNQKNETNENY